MITGQRGISRQDHRSKEVSSGLSPESAKRLKISLHGPEDHLFVDRDLGTAAFSPTQRILEMDRDRNLDPILFEQPEILCEIDHPLSDRDILGTPVTVIFRPSEILQCEGPDFRVNQAQASLPR